MPFGASRLPFLAKVASAAGYGPRTSDSVPISVSGNTQISTSESKFGGSSVVFDGTGDYLTATPVSLGNDFTIEFWYLLPTTTTSYFLGSISDTSNQNGFNILALADNTFRIRKYQSGTAESLFTSSTCITDNTWQHFALVRTSGVMTLYVNGTSRGSANYNINISSSSNFNIGRDALTGSYVNGYIDEVRVSNVARYTSSFTPETTAFTPDGATLLLIHGDGTNGSTYITDDPSARTSDAMSLTLSGNTQISTSQSKFGGSSIYMDGTGDYITVTDNGNFDFGTGDFTIEWFQYLTSLDRFSIDMRGGSNGAKILLYSYPTDGSADDLYLYVNSAVRITGLNCISANQWQHIALVRESGSTRLYVDGSQVGSTWSDTTNYQHGNLLIWENSLSAGSYTPPGYVDEFRVSDVARYSGASLTVPTAAFEPDGKTQLLIHGDGTNGSTNITDDVS